MTSTEKAAQLTHLAAGLGHKLTIMDLGEQYGVLGHCDCSMVARNLVGGVGPAGSALQKPCPHRAHYTQKR